MHLVSQIRTLQEGHDHGTPHGVAVEHDAVGPLVEGVLHHRLEVLPLGEAVPQLAAGVLWRPRVVAIGGDQRRVAGEGKDRHHPKAVGRRERVPVHHDGPGVLADRSAPTAGAYPCGVVPERAWHADLAEPKKAGLERILRVVAGVEFRGRSDRRAPRP